MMASRRAYESGNLRYSYNSMPYDSFYFGGDGR